MLDIVGLQRAQAHDQLAGETGLAARTALVKVVQQLTARAFAMAGIGHLRMPVPLWVCHAAQPLRILLVGG